jgi:hypothetical protein
VEVLANEELSEILRAGTLDISHQSVKDIKEVVNFSKASSQTFLKFLK